MNIARTLRRAGHEDLARILAHRSFTAMRARMLDLVPVESEFPVPRALDEDLLIALDIAIVTTAGNGARATPATVVRELVIRVGLGDPGVACMVALVNRLGETPHARRALERITPGVAVSA